MKVIIAGSRGIRDRSIVEEAIKESGFEITEVVSGGARGVDILGADWAWKLGIPIKYFLPDWHNKGKSAGHIRNRQMADYVGTSGGLIAVWDGKSPGTKGMIDYAQKKGLKVYVKRQIALYRSE